MCAGVLGRQRHHVAFHRGVHRGEAFRTACGDKLAHIIHHQRIAATVTGKAVGDGAQVQNLLGLSEFAQVQYVG